MHFLCYNLYKLNYTYLHYIYFVFIIPHYSVESKKFGDPMLIGREHELAFLEKQYRSAGSAMVALYGKRRTGKTELLKRFCENKRHSFYVCRETTDTEQIRLFSRKVLESSPLGSYIDSFDTWEKAFNFLLEDSKREKTVLVIDEFPYLVQSNPSLPSVLQNTWDAGHEQSQLMLILTGSAMQTMEQQILSGDSPLFGRTDGIYRIDELSYQASMQFLGGYSQDHLLTWATLGGIPRYLKQFTRGGDYATNVLENVLSKGASLYSEVEFLMKYDLREPSTYFAILEALASDCVKIGDISKRTGLDRTKVNVYLKNLMALDVVRRMLPVTLDPDDPPGPHSSQYGFTNHYIRFYFRFLYPHFSALEENEAHRVWTEHIQPALGDFLHDSLITGARQILLNSNKNDQLPFVFRQCGTYWDKDTALDLVATDFDRQLMSILVHTGDHPAGLTELDTLRERTALLKKPSHHKHYGLFSLHGFDANLYELSKLDPAVHLYTFDHLKTMNSREDD